RRRDGLYEQARLSGIRLASRHGDSRGSRQRHPLLPRGGRTVSGWLRGAFRPFRRQGIASVPASSRAAAPGHVVTRTRGEIRMPRLIEVIVSPQGEATVQTKGYAGADCLQASKFLEQ